MQQSLERHSLIGRSFNNKTTWEFQEHQVQEKHSQRSLKRFLFVLRVLIKINSVYLRLGSHYLALITSHRWWNFWSSLKSIQSDDAFVMEAITVASGYVMTDGKCGPNNVDSPWGSPVSFGILIPHPALCLCADSGTVHFFSLYWIKIRKVLLWSVEIN